MRVWSFDFSDFQPALESVTSDCLNRLKKDSTFFAEELTLGYFMTSLQMSRTAWHTVAYLCANQRDVEKDWLWDYVMLVPAINRTILDSLFNIVFLLEDIGPRARWFHESGWREAKERFDREQLAYGHLPEWKEYLDKAGKSIQMIVDKVNIASSKLADPKKVSYWPNPGKMPRHPSQPASSAHDFLQYMNDWFYREMSSTAHLSSNAVMRVAMLALRRNYPSSIRAEIESKYFPAFRAEQVTRTSTCLLALLSEMNHGIRLGLNVEVRRLWALLVASVPESREIYDKRYSALLV